MSAVSALRMPSRPSACTATPLRLARASATAVRISSGAGCGSAPLVPPRVAPAGVAAFEKTGARHQQRAHRLAQLGGTVDHAARKPSALLQADAGRPPGIAMAAGLRDHDDRDQEPRPLDESLRD